MKAYALLSDRSKWTQGALARTASGESIRPRHVDASSWCLYGALLWCYGINTYHDTVLPRVCSIVGDVSIWNDAPERTYEDVVALCRELDI